MNAAEARAFNHVFSIIITRLSLLSFPAQEAVEKMYLREFVILSNAKALSFVSLKRATKSQDCRVAHCKTVATLLLAMTPIGCCF